MSSKHLEKHHHGSLTADVYIGFGTVPTFADAGIELSAAVHACTARGLRVVVTAPSERLREELPAIDPELVVARSHVDLGALLTSSKLVICHGGAGTVLAALNAGVPLLLMPRGSPSQLRMAAACESAAVARRCGADELDTAVNDALGDASLIHAARELQRQMAQMPSPLSVAASIEALAGGQRP